MQRKNLLLIGCGHSHLEILRKFSCAKDSIDFKITLVDPKNQTTYSGMLPGIVAGHYNPKEAQMNLAQIANKCDVEFKKNKIIRLDINNNKAYCENNEAIQFDVAAINIGSKTVTPDIFEPSPNVCSVQAIDSLLRNMQDILSAGKKDHRLKISVIGGGAAGIEIVLAINYFLNKNQIKHDARLITASENILPGYPIRMKRIFSKILTREKIKIVTNDRVSIIKGTNITTESKNHFTSDYVFIATGGTGLVLEVDEQITTFFKFFIFAAFKIFKQPVTVGIIISL